MCPWPSMSTTRRFGASTTKALTARAKSSTPLSPGWVAKPGLGPTGGCQFPCDVRYDGERQGRQRAAKEPQKGPLSWLVLETVVQSRLQSATGLWRLAPVRHVSRVSRPIQNRPRWGLASVIGGAHWARNCPGVMPLDWRKALLKLAWEANPADQATSSILILASPSLRLASSSRAAST